MTLSMIGNNNITGMPIRLRAAQGYLDIKMVQQQSLVFSTGISDILASVGTYIDLYIWPYIGIRRVQAYERYV